MKKEQFKIFKKTLDWAIDRIEKKILDKTSADVLELASGTLRQEIRDFFKKQKQDKKINDSLKVGYYDYLEKGLKRHKGLSKARFSDMKKDFRDELGNRIKNSFALIKNLDNEIISELSSKFINWVTIDSPEIRGDKLNADSLLKFLDFETKKKIGEERLKLIIRDQTSKMIASFDEILARKNNAIACVWRNRGDRRVVGNPVGLYPKGTPSHNDHWEREGKCYLLSDSWALSKGYVKGAIYEDLKDGGVGKAINCRCWLEYIYDLADLPQSYLTNKGRDFLNA